jgi:hypothetical protein
MSAVTFNSRSICDRPPAVFSEGHLGKNNTSTGLRVLASRQRASRRLLARKAKEAGLAGDVGAGLDSSFPDAEAEAADPEDSTSAAQPCSRNAISQQTLGLGAIQPNPNTVLATIIGIVTERGPMSRNKLIEIMRGSSFPHPAARPQDRGWCQGYVAGAIRGGFLAVVADPASTARAHSADATLEG